MIMEHAERDIRSSSGDIDTIIDTLEKNLELLDDDDEFADLPLVLEVEQDLKDAISKAKTKLKKNYKLAKLDKTKREIAQAAKVLNSGTKVLFEAKNEKDWYKVAEYGIAMIIDAAMLIYPLLGPEAALVSAVIAAVGLVISEIVAFLKHEEMSLISKIKKVIADELINYEYDEVTKRKVQGWCQTELTITSELSFYHQKIVKTRNCSFYKGFDPQRLDNEKELMGELVFLAKKQFNELAMEHKDDNKSAEKCLACLWGYASIASVYIMVLSWYKIVANDCLKALASDDSQVLMLKGETEFLSMKIENAKKDAANFLGFLSNKGMLGPAGWWLGKVRVMKEYRQTPIVFGQVENFRTIVGCSPTNYTVDFAQTKLDACIAADICKLTPKFRVEFEGDLPKDNNYLLIFNLTRWPVRVFSGLVGSHKNKFKMKVKPHSHEAHPATDKPNDTYSASGIITIGEEVDELCHMRDVQYIEYGISNNWSYKIYTNPVGIYTEEHLNETYNNCLVTSHDDPKCFSYHNQMCFVRGGIWLNDKFCTSVIFIEGFNEEQLIRASPIVDDVQKCDCDNSSQCCALM